MPEVDFVYAADCPNVGRSREALIRAFVLADLPARWSEHDLADPAAPARVRGFGSPTILIDGRDVAGALPSSEASCRVYGSTSSGALGAPSIEEIAFALTSSRSRGPSSIEPPRAKAGGWRSSLGVLPSAAVAFLPKLVCPACWPAYAGALSAVGLGFLIETRWLFAITVVFLVAALAALGFRAGRRRGYGPFAVGVVAAAGIVFGKFVLDRDAVMYLGVALLISASLWNSWPHRPAAATGCPACIPTNPT